MENKYSHWSVQHIIETGVVDETDGKIINELLKDSRQSTQSIADTIGIKRTTASERIKKLKEREILASFTTKLNLTKCGLPLRAFIMVGYDASKESEGSSQKIVAKRISKIPYVISVDIITGSHDFMVRLGIDAMETLSDVIIERIRDIPGVTNTVSLISFEEYRDGVLITKKKRLSKLLNY
ncbi:MAG: Lrp/AsnC family transcriptional regulator [Candidatus Kariarchaeaceae archaeon]|jgi:DNA-binding Lrp family transcriptional regulator